MSLLVPLGLKDLRLIVGGDFSAARVLKPHSTLTSLQLTGVWVVHDAVAHALHIVEQLGCGPVLATLLIAVNVAMPWRNARWQLLIW